MRPVGDLIQEDAFVGQQDGNVVEDGIEHGGVGPDQSGVEGAIQDASGPVFQRPRRNGSI